MKILVTGGAGYIGGRLVEKLVNRDDVSSVVIYDNLARKEYGFFTRSPERSSKLVFQSEDILDSNTLEQTLKDIDVVYHLAARVSTPFSEHDPHLYEQVNHWGTAELSYAIEKSGVSRVIYLSSTSVYGATEGGATTDTIPNPLTTYGKSKLRAESYLSRLNDKCKSFIVRSGNVYGYSPSMRFDAVINRFAFEGSYLKRLHIEGDGEQKRAFIHVDHLTDQLIEALHSDKPSGIYHGVTHNRSINDIAGALQSLIPELEYLYINQHLQLRSLEASTDPALLPTKDIDDEMFLQELKELLETFTR